MSTGRTSEGLRDETHEWFCVFYEGVAAGFALERAALVEEVVEVGELAVFREDLDQRMPCSGDVEMVFQLSRARTRCLLVDRVMQVADVEPVFEDFSRLGLGDG